MTDIFKFTEYVKAEALKCAKSLEKGPFNYTTWVHLGKCAIILLLVFNRRRIGETSAMLLGLYHKRSKIKTDDHKHLNRLEKILAENFCVMKLVGKRVRHLTVLLSEFHVKLLDVFVSKKFSLRSTTKRNPWMLRNKGNQNLLI